MQSFFYEFEELPALIEGGWQCALINGKAEISYHRDGTWAVVAIALDGHRPIPYSDKEKADAVMLGRHLPVYQHNCIWLDAGTPLHLMILDRLSVEWAKSVQDAVWEKLQEDADDLSDRVADYKRGLLVAGV